MISRLALAAALSLFSVAAIAQQSGTTTTYYPAKPMPGFHDNGPTMPMPQVAPLFMQDEAISSSLMLVNNAARSAGATIAVRTLQGETVLTKHVTLPQYSQQEIPMGKILSAAGVNARVGNISVLQDADLQGMAINAQLLMTDTRNNTPVYFDEEFAMPSMEGSTILRGVADASAGPPLLAINNLADKTQTVTVRCVSEKNGPTTQQVSVAPYGTSMHVACSKSKADSVEAYRQELPESGQAEVDGIEVTGDGMAGTLAAFALAPHRRGGKIIFSAVAFQDPALLKSSTTIYTGVPFGTQSIVPEGQYIPHVALTNFGSKQANITVSVSSSDARSVEDGMPATDVPGAPQTRTVQLTPGQSTEVVLEEAAAASGLQHSISIKSDQPAGIVQSKVIAQGDRELFAIEMLGKDSKEQENAGGHPWTITGDDESTLLLFNHGAAPATIVIYIDAGQQPWQKKYVLAAGETRQISINELVQKAVKDDKGGAIAPSIYSGVVYWSPGESGTVKGRLLVSSKSTVSARSFSCGYFSVICGLTLSTFNSGDIPYLGFSEYASAISQSCLVTTPGQCSSGTQGAPSGVSYSWGFGSAGIVDFNTSSDAYSNQPNFKGVGIGSTSALVNASMGGCQSLGQGNPAPTVVGLRILWNGSDVTNMTSPTTVGQQMPVQASVSLPSGVSITSQSWSIPGITVAGWPGSQNQFLPPSPPNLSISNPTFYWVDAGMGRQITYTAHLSNGAVASAVTTFNVGGPSNVAFTSTLSGVNVAVIQGNLNLSLFAPPSVSGIIFNGSMRPPPGPGGTLSLVQLLTHFDINYSGTNCQIHYGSGLDTQFPLEASPTGVTNITFNDSPGAPLFLDNTETTVSFGAVTYLLWQVNIGGSIPVPLATIPWQWNGDATNINGTWKLNAANSNSSAGASSSTTTYPSWNKAIVLNESAGSYPCH